MNPGATINPPASNPPAPSGAPFFPAGPTSLIFSPSTNTSSAASVFDAGSITRPFLIRSIGGFLGFHFQRRVRVSFGGAAGEQIEDSHAHRHAVRDLLQHAGLRPVRHL